MTDEKDPPIIEGEFVEEVGSSKSSSSSKKAKSKSGNKAEKLKVVPEEKQSSFSKLPWVLFGILLIFTTGLFAEPFAERGIRKFFPNLLPAPEAESQAQGLSENDQAQIADLKTNIEGLGRRLGIVEQALASLDEEASARDKRIDALPTAGSGTTAGTAQVPESLLNDVTVLKTGLDAVVQQLATLEGRLGTLETGSATQSSEMGTLKTTVEQLAERQVALEAGLATATSGTGVGEEALANVMATLNALNTRLQALESNQSETSMSQGLAISAARLSNKALSGAAFADELLAIEVLVADGPALIRAQLAPSLSTLRMSAHKGYANMATLREDLLVHAGEALKLSERPDEEKSWYTNVLDSLAGLVSVRRTDMLEGNSNEARINRALEALKADDVVLAVTEIDQLSPDARSVFEPWLALAGDRVAGEMALRTILDESLKPVRNGENDGGNP